MKKKKKLGPQDLEKLQKKLKTLRTVAVFLGSRDVEEPAYNAAAAVVGKFLAVNNLTLIYGGAGIGTMKVLADTVLANGGNVVGVFPKTLSNNILHPGLTEQIIVPNITERKKVMLEKADAIVVLPGGLGTLDEFFSALEEIKRKRKPLGALNVNGYFDSLIAFLDHANTTGFLSDSQRMAVVFHDDLASMFFQMLGNCHDY